MIVCLAVPVQSQTPVPTVPPRLINPTAANLAPCGLPASYAQFDDSAAVTTFNMTADCVFNSWSVQSNLAFLYFTAGEFTINGNGHSIIGPSNTWTLYVQNAGTILNLNNVTIRGAGGNRGVEAILGGRLNARRVIFRDNTGNLILMVNNSEAHLEDVQFLNNSVTANTDIPAIVYVIGENAHLSITNGIFTGNTANIGRIINVGALARFSGSGITFSDNSARSVILGTLGSRVTLQNVQFLNNRQTPLAAEPRGSAVTARSAMVTLTNGIFRANRNTAGSTDVILFYAVDISYLNSIQLQGCLTFESNVQSDGSTAANDHRVHYDILVIDPLEGQRVIDSRTGVCPPGFRSPKKKKEEAPAVPTSTPRPAYGASYVALQTETGMTFEATYGLDSGVHFRQLDGAGIGVQSIIDAGYLAALDVYGYVEQGVEVCFPQAGRVIFLDARTMPRAITALESTIVNGMTCVYLDSPGSLVLLPN